MENICVLDKRERKRERCNRRDRRDD